MFTADRTEALFLTRENNPLTSFFLDPEGLNIMPPLHQMSNNATFCVMYNVYLW